MAVEEKHQVKFIESLEKSSISKYIKVVYYSYSRDIQQHTKHKQNCAVDNYMQLLKTLSIGFNSS